MNFKRYQTQKLEKGKSKHEKFNQTALSSPSLTCRPDFQVPWTRQPKDFFHFSYRVHFLLLCEWWMSLLMKCPLQKEQCFLQDSRLTIPASSFASFACLSCCFATSGKQVNATTRKYNWVCTVILQIQIHAETQIQILPCSPKQCGSECLLENSHRNLIQPFIRCSRRQQPPW